LIYGNQTALHQGLVYAEKTAFSELQGINARVWAFGFLPQMPYGHYMAITYIGWMLLMVIICL
jgi:hypothetical protein